MIASVAFQNFKALRNARLDLHPFNLVIGPNGSGKTSLIQALLRLRKLAALGSTQRPAPVAASDHGPRLTFRFTPPHEQVEVRLVCVADGFCNGIQVDPAAAPDWPRLQAQLTTIRAFLFDHYAMAGVADETKGGELSSNGGNLSGALAVLQREAPAAFAELETDFMQVMPEFSRFEFRRPAEDQVELALRLRDEDSVVVPENLSQGTLYLLGMMAVAYHPQPPAVVCFEEIDRGMHPRMLRQVRDVLYRLSYPESHGIKRAAVQVVATTHSPYLLDQYREHPEEVVISHKQGNAAHFENLGSRHDLAELLEGSSLGDIWFSGILGGVPEE